MKKYLGIAVAATLALGAPAYAWNGWGGTVPTNIQEWAWNGGECALILFRGDGNIYEINTTQLGEKGYEHFINMLEAAYYNDTALQYSPGGTAICGAGVIPINGLNKPCSSTGIC